MLKRYANGAWRRLNRYVSRTWLGMQTQPDGFSFERYGEGHAAWWVPSDTKAGAIAYCGGVGRDATFDFGLAEEKGMVVHSFDPTPGSIAYMEEQNRDRVNFHAWGMLDRDEVMRFHSPANPQHANWFIDNLHGTDDYFEAPCYTIKTIMEKLGHTEIELLKIDIEGSWGQVLHSMLESKIYPRTVCVEFDSPAPLSRVRGMTRALQAAGYVLARRDKENCVFVKKG
ncbi:MAG: FkbM family methyltransferase [Pseudomonadota bacterium]|nr:FkbM family methyltransferase [Pseudomonadota bacterium]